MQEQKQPNRDVSTKSEARLPVFVYLLDMACAIFQDRNLANCVFHKSAVMLEKFFDYCDFDKLGNFFTETKLKEVSRYLAIISFNYGMSTILKEMNKQVVKKSIDLVKTELRLCSVEEYIRLNDNSETTISQLSDLISAFDTIKINPASENSPENNLQATESMKKIALYNSLNLIQGQCDADTITSEQAIEYVRIELDRLANGQAKELIQKLHSFFTSKSQFYVWTRTDVNIMSQFENEIHAIKQRIIAEGCGTVLDYLYNLKNKNVLQDVPEIVIKNTASFLTSYCILEKTPPFDESKFVVAAAMSLCLLKFKNSLKNELVSLTDMVENNNNNSSSSKAVSVLAQIWQKYQAKTGISPENENFLKWCNILMRHSLKELKNQKPDEAQPQSHLSR